MRLIDSDALIEELNNSHFPGAPYVDAGISIAIGKVLDAPTIEPSAQPDIIRCKDCKHRIEHKHYGDLGESAYTCEGNMGGWILPDGSCSHAEREAMDDVISRQAAIDALRYAQHRFTVADEAGGMGTVKWSEDVIYFAAAERVLTELPPAQPDSKETSSTHKALDTISRHAAIDLAKDLMIPGADYLQHNQAIMNYEAELVRLPSAQPDIKQAAKLLSDFVESCPGGDSYLITPDGEELRTDWGYAMDGVKLIYEWAERRTDG